MNIDKLIVAAKKIDKLAEKQDAKTKAWQDLAIEVKEGKLSFDEKVKKMRDLDGSAVVDFETAINELRRALRSR